MRALRIAIGVGIAAALFAGCPNEDKSGRPRSEETSGGVGGGGGGGGAVNNGTGGGNGGGGGVKNSTKAENNGAGGAAGATAQAQGGVGMGDLKIIDQQLGNGLEAVAGKTVTVHYTGTLENGKKFDSSVDRGQPFKFALGKGQVIKGWDQGVAGMKVGGKRRLEIPPEMAYGERGFPPVIPPNSKLIFEVELLAVN
jgi:hypothetical protein